MDRMDTDHKLTHVAVKLRRKGDLNEVAATVLGRAKQAHHGIEEIGRASCRERVCLYV